MQQFAFQGRLLCSEIGARLSAAGADEPLSSHLRAGNCETGWWMIAIFYEVMSIGMANKPVVTIKVKLLAYDRWDIDDRGGAGVGWNEKGRMAFDG